MIAKPITFFGKPVLLICDAQCQKAWGINQRPKRQLSENHDDVEWLADDELGDAPADPGTYEGGHGKPQTTADRLNKWCCRECERSTIVSAGEDFTLPDFSRRLRNIPIGVRL